MRFPLLLLAAMAPIALAGACGGDDDPTRTVQLDDDLLEVELSQQWQLEWNDGDELVFARADHDDMRLRIKGHTESIGQPITVTALKGMIGRDLNVAYGGVSSRVSMGGNAMIRYAREQVDENDEAFQSVDWVLAKPVGFDDFARVEISLRMSPALWNAPATADLVERLDRRIGSARIPRA